MLKPKDPCENHCSVAETFVTVNNNTFITRPHLFYTCVFSRYREEQGASDGEENDDDDNDRDNEIMNTKSSDDDCDGVD